MKLTSIIPLAGPDFVDVNNDIKALKNFRGDYFLNYILKSRSWFSSIKKYIFVLHDNVTCRAFSREYLLRWFPNSEIIFLSNFTNGAALSTLSATCFCDESCPVVVDLADIYYKIDFNILYDFEKYENLGAIVPSFKSKSTHYSYLRYGQKGEFIEAREKDVISNNATAGTYIYKSPSVLLKAISWHLSEGESYKHNNLYYLCPTLNGLKFNHMGVRMVPALEVEDVKIT